MRLIHNNDDCEVMAMMMMMIGSLGQKLHNAVGDNSTECCGKLNDPLFIFWFESKRLK
jgi:hypothetical protein